MGAPTKRTRKGETAMTAAQQTGSRRWTIYGEHAERIPGDDEEWVNPAGVLGELERDEEVEVMPVAEHVRLREAAEAMVEAWDRHGSAGTGIARAALRAALKDEQCVAA